MANGRTARISKRDLEVLEFVARFGVVSREAVATWAGTAQTCTLERERRLREAELLDVRCGVWGEGKIAACTRAGLALCGRGELPPARFSLATVRHETTVAEIAAAFESRGERTMSEREIVAYERERGERVLSAKLAGDRFHRADLIRFAREDEPPEAIEVELSAKGSSRLDELLRAWRWAVSRGRLARVAYRCPPRIGALVTRAVERTQTDEQIAVEEL